MTDDAFTVSSGNIFADLGVPDAADMLVKSDLALDIVRAMRDRDWTHTQAAQVMGIDHAHVSRIRRGEIEGDSIDTLLHLLTLLQRNVVILVRESEGQTGSLRVHAG